MSDALMVNFGSADWPKKGSWPQHIPVPLSNVSALGVFTSIYLKLITYAHILLIAMLYYTRFKTNKAKIYRPTTAPFLSLAQDFWCYRSNLSFFIKHLFVRAANLPRDVWSICDHLAQSKQKRTYPLRLTRGFACAHFWSASTQRKHGVFALRFQRVRSEENIIEGALMTKRP